MPRIRLIRAVSRPSGRGPGNGQHALQRALQARGVDWLAIGGPLRSGEIPWFWCWLDRPAAALCAATDYPFVVGPNVLFDSSGRPCGVWGEREVCKAASCRLMFTESDWYRRLIRRHLGPASRAPIVVWPYPIEPAPAGPLPASYDLLIYAKSGYAPSLIVRLRRAYPRSALIRYGRYRRRRLIETARRSRSCVYLSDDDRGPLALAEILLSGCPAVGLPSGAPFVRHGQTGMFVECLTIGTCLAAIEDCLRLDRCAVAAAAAAQFDTGRIVDTVLAALEEARRA